MMQLIITIVAIALTVLLTIATISYVPWWHKTAGDTEQLMRSSMSRLESVYDVAVRAANGMAPSVTLEADGGLSTNFLSFLTFTPAAPPGHTWVYGVHANDGSRYANLNYFCLQPTAGYSGTTEGVYRGIERARSLYSQDQVFLSDRCDATADWSRPTTFPVPMHVTLFVAYTPGINK